MGSIHQSKVQRSPADGEPIVVNVIAASRHRHLHPALLRPVVLLPSMGVDTLERQHLMWRETKMPRSQKSKGEKPKSLDASTAKATKRAAIYLESFHRVPQEDVARFGEPAITPLDVQEQACRAYCERMGYKVFGVHRATKLPPDNVKLQWVLSGRVNSSSPGASTEWRLHHLYDSRHPFYWVRNLLEEASVDVVVEFREVGPSGPMFPKLAKSPCAVRVCEHVGNQAAYGQGAAPL